MQVSFRKILIGSLAATVFALPAVSAELKIGVVDYQRLFEESPQAKVVREGALPGTPPVAVLGPGDSVGEIALVRGSPRTATVRSRTPVNVLTMDRDTFQALFAHVPPLRLSPDTVPPIPFSP